MYRNIGLRPAALLAQLAESLAKPDADVTLGAGHPTMMAVGFDRRVGYARQELPGPVRPPFQLRALILIVTLTVLGSGVAQVSSTLSTARVRIEATELDRRMLLQKLNSHGRDHGMKFEEVETEYDYRIVFGTGQGKTDSKIWGSGGSFNSSMATADVFDGKGTELFRFDRKQRGTDAGATNAVAKEIIKRILKLRSTPAK